MKEVAELCVNCKMCRDECDARVNIPKLMLEAKAAHQAEHGLERADWVLARAESFAAIGSNFAPIVNALLGAAIGSLGHGETLRALAPAPPAGVRALATSSAGRAAGAG